MKTTKVFHKKHKCIGCNACILTAPQNWEMDNKEGTAHLKNSKKIGGTAKDENIFEAELLTEQEIDSNKQAQYSCPTNAIRVED